jgi:hypothetical protein
MSSNETADVIADGSLGRCISEKKDWTNSLMMAFDLPPQQADLGAEEYDRTLRKWVISLILDARTTPPTTSAGNGK